MTTPVEDLTLARNLYATSPSHCDSFDYPERGTYCIITALTTAGAPVYPSHQIMRIVCQGELTAYVAEHTTEEVVARFNEAIEAVSTVDGFSAFLDGAMA